MYRFEWAVLVTDALMDELRAAAGDPMPADEVLRTSIARVLAQVGGLPVVEEPLSPDQRTATTRTLLHEALLHATRDARRLSDSDDGYVVDSSPSIPDAGQVARGVERVGINSASIPVLRGLGLGASVSANIVKERQTNGRLGSLKELDERVRGIGPTTIAEIAHAVHFDLPPAPSPARLEAAGRPIGGATFATDLATLVAGQRGREPRERLLSALDLLATHAATDPHPATRQRRIRRQVPKRPADGVQTDWIGVLFGSDYYHRVPLVFDRATTSIDVCMFHIAAPDPGHPTYKLLEGLVRAHLRGVRVRVLMDQDRESDPYRSTVINSAARVFLTANGVECRFDASELLLHSKFLLVDGTLSVVGSHNWSAGSYFQFDDLSMMVRSRPFTQQMETRFDSLWQHGV